jgi:hypothetical protein
MCCAHSVGLERQARVWDQFNVTPVRLLSNELVSQVIHKRVYDYLHMCTCMWVTPCQFSCFMWVKGVKQCVCLLSAAYIELQTNKLCVNIVVNQVACY